MSAFNRVFVVISLGLLLVAGAVFLIAPDVVVGLVQSLAEALDTALFAELTEVGRFAVRTLLALGWVALFALFIWLEVRRAGTPTVEVARYTGGNTIRVSTAAVADRVRENVATVEGILGTRVSVVGRDRAVEVKVDVFAERSVDLITKAEEIAALVRRVIQDELGLKLATKPQISIQPHDGRLEVQPKFLRLPFRPAPQPAHPVPVPASPLAALGEPIKPADQPKVALPPRFVFTEADEQLARALAETATRSSAPPATDEPQPTPPVLAEPEQATQPTDSAPEIGSQPPAERDLAPESKPSAKTEANDLDASEARRHA
ncbi:MAG: hypothetical protein RMM31_04050 [Anaerolineae bacterium]|nr:hypothetical protein [Thermoflexales bacterium]MDW8395397.1 hypothetical protein [Anaerolineae bacterium]